MADRVMNDRFAIAPDWRGRGLAFLRFLIFVVVFAAGSVGLNSAQHRANLHVSLATHFFVSMIGLALLAVVLAAIMAWLSRRRFLDYGYSGPLKLRNFGIGAGCGIGLLAAQLAVTMLLGLLNLHPSANGGLSLLWYGIFYAGLFLTVACAEESAFRGYPLVELSRAISFWPTAILFAAIFGAMHGLKGGDENFLGGLQAATFALALAYSFRATGSLWLAIGYHAGWDYAETFIFGVPDSGLAMPGSLLHPMAHGPAWITGGAVGPEGSILAIVPPLIVAFVSWRIGKPTGAGSSLVVADDFHLEGVAVPNPGGIAEGAGKADYRDRNDRF